MLFTVHGVTALIRSEQMAILIYGIVLSVMNVLFYFALARIPLGVAVAIEFTGPLSVAIFTSRHTADILWIVLAVCGILLLLPITSFSTPLDPTGILLAFGAGVCWGLYIIVGQRAGSTIPGGIVTAWGVLIGSCIAIPIGLIHARPIAWTPAIVGLAVLTAVLSSALPYSLEMLALKRLPAKTFSIFMSLEPAVAAVLGLIFLHEQLTTPQWIAIKLRHGRIIWKYCDRDATSGSSMNSHPLVIYKMPGIDNVP